MQIIDLYNLALCCDIGHIAILYEYVQLQVFLSLCKITGV